MTKRRTRFVKCRPKSVATTVDGCLAIMDNPKNPCVPDGFIRVNITVEKTFPRLPGETEKEAVRRIRGIVKSQFKSNWPIVSPENILFFLADSKYQPRLMGMQEIRRRASEEPGFRIGNLMAYTCVNAPSKGKRECKNAVNATLRIKNSLPDGSAGGAIKEAHR